VKPRDFCFLFGFLRRAFGRRFGFLRRDSLRFCVFGFLRGDNGSVRLGYATLTRD
jgi:hypothetical protein